MGRSFSWASPETIDKMYVDEKDHHGIWFWYNDVKEQQPKPLKK